MTNVELLGSRAPLVERAVRRAWTAIATVDRSHAEKSRQGSHVRWKAIERPRAHCGGYGFANQQRATQTAQVDRRDYEIPSAEDRFNDCGIEREHRTPGSAVDFALAATRIR